MTIKVAVPPPQHSARFGQRASSQTVDKPREREASFKRATFGPVGSETFNHGGRARRSETELML
jgi:hypothetical protein